MTYRLTKIDEDAAIDFAIKYKLSLAQVIRGALLALDNINSQEEIRRLCDPQGWKRDQAVKIAMHK